MVTASDASGTLGEYFYDGDGKRVEKYVPSTGETTVFVYDAAGKEIAEYSTIVANPTDAKVNYLTVDHLGSPRINTDANGAVISRHDYMPFGEEIATSQRTSGLSYEVDTVRKQFTGYERDSETDLDFAQARYYSNVMGRFIVPDDFFNDTNIFDPGSWNLYAYVRNKPTLITDPSGEHIYIEFVDSDGNAQTVQYYRGKLYTTSKDKHGNLVRGAEYTGDNEYANDAKDYLNRLRSDPEAGFNGMISTLERSSQAHTIKKPDDPTDPHRNEDQVVPISERAARANLTTGSTVYWSDAFQTTRALPGIPSFTSSPMAVLAHELLGHAYDLDQGLDNLGVLWVPNTDVVGNPLPNNASSAYDAREPNAVSIENRALAIEGRDQRDHYGYLKVPTSERPVLKPRPKRP